MVDGSVSFVFDQRNISPALKGSCDMDFKLKSELIVDVFNTVGFKIKELDAAKQFIRNGYIIVCQI
jgi:hypothetical protein